MGMWYSAEETIEYCFREVVGTPQVKRLDFENLIWACGGMVDTLVLGTSAKSVRVQVSPPALIA